jgi:hypothetical protein
MNERKTKILIKKIKEKKREQNKITLRMTRINEKTYFY